MAELEASAERALQSQAQRLEKRFATNEQIENINPQLDDIEWDNPLSLRVNNTLSYFASCM